MRPIRPIACGALRFQLLQRSNGASSLPVFDPANVAGSPFAFLMLAVFAMPPPVRMCTDFADSINVGSRQPTERALPCLLNNAVTFIAAIYSGGRKCRSQLQVGQVLHLRPANRAFERRDRWHSFLGHGLYDGGFNSLERRFFISGVFSGSGTSQSNATKLASACFHQHEAHRLVAL